MRLKGKDEKCNATCVNGQGCSRPAMKYLEHYDLWLCTQHYWARYYRWIGEQ